MITASVHQVGEGVRLVGETGGALARIASQVAEIDTLINDIATSTDEQARGLQEVNTAVNQMDQMTQQNAAMVEQSNAATQALSQEIVVLVTLTERFQVRGVAPAKPFEPPAASGRQPTRRPGVVVGNAARKPTIEAGGRSSSRLRKFATTT